MSTTDFDHSNYVEAAYTLTFAEICQAFVQLLNAEADKTPEQVQLDAERNYQQTIEGIAADYAVSFLSFIDERGSRTAPPLVDVRNALVRRGQRGLVVSTHNGHMDPGTAECSRAHWLGYLSALADLVDGTGLYLACKDAESADEPLSALDRAAQSLGENAHHLTLTEVQERLREAGVELATNAVANGHAVGAEGGAA